MNAAHEAPPAKAPGGTRFPSLPYVLPFVLYLLLTQIPALVPDAYAWLYPSVVVIVAAVTIGLLHGRHLLRPHRHVLAGVFVGLIGIAFWIFLSELHLEKQLGELLPEAFRPSDRPGFDPFTNIVNAGSRWAFIGMRILGLAILVPVAEELFWRGFLLRWLIAPNWQEQELGRFTWYSFFGVVLLFTLAHPEWLAAAVYCALLNGLIYWKRDLWNCVIAHGVSNLALGVYILITGHWSLW